MNGPFLQAIGSSKIIIIHFKDVRNINEERILFFNYFIGRHIHILHPS